MRGSRAGSDECHGLFVTNVTYGGGQAGVLLVGREGALEFAPALPVGNGGGAPGEAPVEGVGAFGGVGALPHAPAFVMDGGDFGVGVGAVEEVV